MAISADFIFSQMYTPFPAAKPSALTTKGNLLVFKNSSACFDFSKIPNLAVGILYFSQSFLVNIFEPSSCEAIFSGPNILIFCF